MFSQLSGQNLRLGQIKRRLGQMVARFGELVQDRAAVACQEVSRAEDRPNRCRCVFPVSVARGHSSIRMLLVACSPQPVKSPLFPTVRGLTLCVGAYSAN